MKITKAHLEFWASKKAPKVLLAHRGHVPSIHDLINSQVEVPRKQRDCENAVSNLLAILALKRKRGVMLEGLYEMARQPGTLSNPELRAAYCRRWLRKILKGSTR